MNLEKARIILTINNDHHPDYTDQERREAHLVSIDAIIRLQRLRSDKHADPLRWLPGETEE